MWSEKETELLRLVYGKATKTDLMLQFPDKPYPTIVTKANKLGLYVIQDGECLTKLEDNSLVSWYWLGFILADGHMSQNQLQISLAAKDVDHLYSLCSYLNYPKIKIRPVLNAGEIIAYKMSVGTKKRIEELKKIIGLDGITNKTKSPPNLKFLDELSNEQLVALFAGYLDGDGHIGQNCILFTIDSNWGNFIFTLYSKIETCIQNKNEFHKSVNSRGYCVFRIKNKAKKEIIPLIESLALPLLYRKYNKPSLLVGSATGPRNAMSKLTCDSVKEIKRLLPTMSVKELATKFSVGKTTIHNIKNGVIWKYVREEEY